MAGMRRSRTLVLALALCAAGACAGTERDPDLPRRSNAPNGHPWIEIPESDWETLFDGVSLDGWKETGDAAWAVADGTLCGATGGGQHSFLVTARSFGDFVLELEVLAERSGNSGIQIRSRLDGGVMRGYQIEVDPSPRAWSGGLYEEGGRGWLQDLSDNPAARAAFRPDGWNRYRIECRGPRIRSWVNGVAAADYAEAAVREGVIGLQVHGGADVRVLWRNIRIRRLGPEQPDFVLPDPGD
ncbi:MAG: DUF1080 domain-containing protein [Planctomycetota bacterium]|nr:MAG: DUF1080 domain-containing protein [Planctomycetota bacterium]